MKYNIYFHNDFDGAVSAAIMLQFFEHQGDVVRRLIPIDFSVKTRWAKMKLEHPSVILDFLYHPGATFWFDHHSTTFVKKEWERRFREDPYHRLDTRFASCCDLVLDSLKKHFGFKATARIRELIRWGNIIDKANYDSPEQAVLAKTPAIQVSTLIDRLAHTKGFFDWFVPMLASESLQRIVALKRVRVALKKIKTERKRSLAFYKKNLKVRDGISYIDISKSNVQSVWGASYYLYPELLYSVSLKKDSGKIFHLNVAANPWRRRENTVHIGKLLGRYFGGGHKDVGGVEFKSRKDAEKAIRTITNILHNAAQRTLRK